MKKFVQRTKDPKRYKIMNVDDIVALEKVGATSQEKAAVFNERAKSPRETPAHCLYRDAPVRSNLLTKNFNLISDENPRIGFFTGRIHIGQDQYSHIVPKLPVLSGLQIFVSIQKQSIIIIVMHTDFPQTDSITMGAFEKVNIPAVSFVCEI